MPKPTPDRSIDQLLKTTLRRDTTQASAECVDAETLAAWSEGTLSSERSYQVEVHLGDCTRCQAFVATFVRTEPVAPAAIPFWRHWSVRWVVPLAAAASLVLWISRTSGRDTTAPSSTVARVESPAEISAAPRPVAGAATNERQDVNRPLAQSADAAADKVNSLAETANGRRSEEAELARTQEQAKRQLAKRQDAASESAGSVGGMAARIDRQAASAPPPAQPPTSRPPQALAQEMAPPPPAVQAPATQTAVANATIDGAMSDERRVAAARDAQMSASVTSGVLFEVVTNSAQAIDAIGEVAPGSRGGGGGGRGGVGFGRGVGAGRGVTAGTLTGTLTDAQGGVIPGVTVRVTRSGASIADAVTDATGRFRVAALEPGDYQIDFTMSGFRTASRSNVNISGGTETVVDAAMQVAVAAESVQMKSENAAGAAAARPAPSPSAPLPAAAIGLRGAPLRQIAASPTRWRVLASGRVERSTDGGSSWESIFIDPSVTLTAGSSPARNVCWLIGTKGAIFLTSDGIHFARVPFPETTDIVSVKAIDAQHATVTTAPGRTFATADGGRTWGPGL